MQCFRPHNGGIVGALLAIACVLVAPRGGAAQEVRTEQREHLTVGMLVGIYPTGGGFGLGDQSFEYQGVHLDAIRLGLSQLVATAFKMELSVLFGLSVLADPGYVGVDPAGVRGRSNLGFHWGFGVGGYYRFDVGLTLGLGLEIAFASGAYLDTSFFRVGPAIGWELSDPLHDWYVHIRWVTGISVLAGLEEANTAPESNLTTTGIGVVYGF